MDKDLSFLTEKQKTAYILRHQGKKFREISTEMNISISSARQHVSKAEKMIKEHECHINYINEKNKISLNINVSFEELKLIIQGLYELSFNMKKNIDNDISSYWKEKLPYEYTVTEKLLNRVQTIYNNIQTSN